jgi:hypothetical protein
VLRPPEFDSGPDRIAEPIWSGAVLACSIECRRLCDSDRASSPFALAAVSMYLTRHIDGYELDSKLVALTGERHSPVES